LTTGPVFVESQAVKQKKAMDREKPEASVTKVPYPVNHKKQD
jgi:hypothetical protein